MFEIIKYILFIAEGLAGLFVYGVWFLLTHVNPHTSYIRRYIKRIAERFDDMPDPDIRKTLKCLSWLVLVLVIICIFCGNLLALHGLTF